MDEKARRWRVEFSSVRWQYNNKMIQEVKERLELYNTLCITLIVNMIQ